MDSRLPDVDPGLALVDALGLKKAHASSKRVQAAFVGKYQGTTKLQRAVMREVSDGHSVLVVAPTASGKTEAGAMALADLATREAGRIVYIAPTRALINDLVERLRPGFTALGWSVAARHAESQASDQALSGAACVLITPEALEAALERHATWVNGVRYLILDELHSVDGQPRGTQLRALTSRIQQRLEQSLTTVALSATVPDLAAAAAYWGANGRPLTPVVETDSRRRSITAASGGTEWLKAWVRSPRAPAKLLVFANSRRRCDELFTALVGNSDHVVLVHYSNLETSLRRETEESLRRLPRVVCVATSTLELGVDIGDVDAAVLADPPWSTLALIQRVGRAGRRTQTSVGYATPTTDRSLLRLIAVSELSAGESDDDGVAPRHHSVAVQQAICLIAGSKRGRIRAGQLDAALKDTGLVAANEALAILEHLRSKDVLVYSPALDSYEIAVGHEDLLRGAERWGNFPIDRARWTLRVRGKLLAIVNTSQRPEPGDVLLFAGRHWRIQRIDKSVLHVLSATPVPEPIRVRYDDVAPLVPARTAGSMRAAAHGHLPMKSIHLDPELKTRLYTLRECLREFDGGNVVLETEDGRKLVTFAGTRANLMLMAYLRGSQADEVGVLFGDRAVPTLPSAPEDVIAGASQAWETLGRTLPATRWQSFLPARLRREEIMSQLIGPGVIRSLSATLSRPIIELGALPISL